MSSKQRLKCAMIAELDGFKNQLPKGIGAQQTADMTVSWVTGLTAAFVILQESQEDDYGMFYDALTLGHALLELNEKIAEDSKQGPAIILPFNR